VFTVIRAGIIGATGYFGLELVRLLARHPDATISGVYSRTYAGQRFSDVYPHTAGQFDQGIVAFEPEMAEGLDVLFLCAPHGVAARTVPGIRHGLH
jgi:N-acetyl-gamma-glutamyl-phosphate reductase